MPPTRRPSFETERLILRPFETGDAPGLHRCFGDPQAMRYWDSGPCKSLAETQARLGWSMRASPIRHAAWALVPRQGGEAIGMVNYHRREPKNRKLEIGYILARAHWRRGLMTEAVGALLGHCFGKLEAHRIEATIEPQNLASIGVVAHFGFSREAELLRDRLLVEGEFRSVALYALLEPDWAARQAKPVQRKP